MTLYFFSKVFVLLVYSIALVFATRKDEMIFFSRSSCSWFTQSLSFLNTERNNHIFRQQPYHSFTQSLSFQHRKMILCFLLSKGVGTINELSRKWEILARQAMLFYHRSWTLFTSSHYWRNFPVYYHKFSLVHSIPLFSQSLWHFFMLSHWTYLFTYL